MPCYEGMGLTIITEYARRNSCGSVFGQEFDSPHLHQIVKEPLEQAVFLFHTRIYLKFLCQVLPHEYISGKIMEMNKYFPNTLSYFEGDFKMSKKKRLFDMALDIEKKFAKHFNYGCEMPIDVYLEKSEAIAEFEKVIDKCIADNFDYTIKLYGTRPLPKGDPEQILID